MGSIINMGGIGDGVEHVGGRESAPCDPHEFESEVLLFSWAAIVLPATVLLAVLWKLGRLWRRRVLNCCRGTGRLGLAVLLANQFALILRLGCGSLYFSTNDDLFYHTQVTA